MNPEFTFKELKNILENLGTPERLDNHPWTKSLTVNETIMENPGIQQKNSGYQLAFTLCRIFRMMIPGTLPKRGKRLDTQWCQFGLLAAQYFAPFEFGYFFPKSLRDAAGRIDNAIYLYIFNKPEEHLDKNETAPYTMIGNEAASMPISTLSDWHKMGLQSLFDFFCKHEQYLVNSWRPSSGVTKNERFQKFHMPVNVLKVWFRRFWPKVCLGILAILILFIGIKAVRVYSEVRLVKEDFINLKSLIKLGNVDWSSQFHTVGPLISKTRTDMANLDGETASYLWLGRGFSWVPTYGGDLANAQNIMAFANGLIIAVDETYQASSPILDSLKSTDNKPEISNIVKQLQAANPQLTESRSVLDKALIAESKIDIKTLSPNSQSLFQSLNPVVSSFDDALTVALALPDFVGASGSGPKTYMLLLQNEDELRATGGFITAVGTVAVENGKVLSYKIEDSYALDDPNQYYPPAPWQLANYMEASHWLLRDANWFPDFPTSARWTEMFFAMSQSYGVDGVIAVDQQAIRSIIAGLGPIQVSGVPYPITADNVIGYMRLAKSPTSSEKLDNDWWLQRKDFMQGLAQAILDRIQSGNNVSWVDFSSSLKQALDERHILLESDNSLITSLLAKHGWDGAIRPTNGDFLMVVDSNLGFNKVNAVVRENLRYEVDLSDLQSPTSTLTVNNQNNATGNPSCEQGADYGDGSYASLINRCYWDYLRVYSRADAILTKSFPMAIPGSWLMGGKGLPAQVDDLVDENNSRVKGYGTFLVVPAGSKQAVTYRFGLSTAILKTVGSNIIYSLYVQKQPGTPANPIEIIVHLPINATILYSSLKAEKNGENWIFTSDLHEDLQFELTFASKRSG